MTVQQEAAIRTAIPFVTATAVAIAFYLAFTFVPVEWIAVGLAVGVFAFLIYHVYQINLYNVTDERRTSTKEQ